MAYALQSERSRRRVNAYRRALYHGAPLYHSVAEIIGDVADDDSVHVIRPNVIAERARAFVAGSPGEVLFAVKANPHPAVLQTIWEAGVRGFDVASMGEIELVYSLFPTARMCFMHPIKSRQSIRRAYALGVRDFAFDHIDELTKIVEETGGAKDLGLLLRLSPRSSGAAYALAGKFGATVMESQLLLEKARPLAARLGLTFHVGSQCMIPEDYASAIAIAAELIRVTGVKVDMLDVGGGYPVTYPGMTPPPLQDYFDAIEAAVKKEGLTHLSLALEPGRALVADGGATLARIEMRRDQMLYLNDGVYGSLFDAGTPRWRFSTRLWRDGKLVEGDEEAFGFFGPTCDSIDRMEGPFMLPADAQEGDWVEVIGLGAYGLTMTTQFNGFHQGPIVALIDNL
ncbi:type III PLP-dependent enzyme [Pseudokordiimonas caeni]|uniref:type III PLP-dependent enzyme n=1 Tax=Pseudokordiimonas caeni TaxID=2997908 RepID=UPI00281280E4|nr:type III PLP-dependent enzyme [Pseudokordiimonas caeni]